MSFGLHLLVIVLVGTGVAVFLGIRQDQVPLRRALLLAVGPVLAGILGMRVLFVVLHPEMGTAPLDWINIFAGNHAPGAVAGAGFYCLMLGRSTRALVADRAAIGLSLAMIVTRLGCVANGCCQPLALPYVGLGIAMLVLSIVAYPRRRYDGQVLLLAMLLYFGGSTVLEGYRYDPRFWERWPQLQAANALLFATTVVWMVAGHAWRALRAVTSLREAHAAK